MANFHKIFLIATGVTVLAFGSAFRRPGIHSDVESNACITNSGDPEGLSRSIKRVIATPELAGARTDRAFLSIDTSLVTVVTDTTVCRLAAEASRRYYMGADTGTLYSVAVVAMDTSRFVVANTRELYRGLPTTVSGDTFSGGFLSAKVLTMNSSYTVLATWSWLH